MSSAAPISVRARGRGHPAFAKNWVPASAGTNGIDARGPPLCTTVQTKTPPVLSRRGFASMKNRRSDRHLQFLGGAEGDLLARLDLDRLAGRRIAAHAGGALAHLENAEPGDLDPLAFFQVLGDKADEIFEHLLTLLLGHLVLLGQGVGQMLGGDRLARFRRTWGCCHRFAPRAHHAPCRKPYEIRGRTQRPAKRKMLKKSAFFALRRWFWAVAAGAPIVY